MAGACRVLALEAPDLIVISYGIAGVPEWRTIQQWEHEARRFFSLLLTEGDIDAFWQKHLRQ